jgi:Zn-dependent protease
MFDFTPHAFLMRVLMVIPMWLSLSVHEWAHAYSAFRLGDDTAKMQGRLTLNPMAHVDWIGTVLLPLLGIPFGWAKPVPVNPTRFRRDVSMGTGMAITAFAGPFSNIVLAALSALVMGLMLRFVPDLIPNRGGLFTFLLSAMSLNIGLAIFNMIPLPPLDGSRIMERVLPYSLRAGYAQLANLGPLMMIIIFKVGGPLIQGPVTYVQEIFIRGIQAIAML